MGISDDGLLGANAVVIAGMLIFLTVNSVLNFGSGLLSLYPTLDR